MDFRVADLTLAEFGRNEIRLAEHEMPGLMAMRDQFGESKPLAGARIAGSLHMTVQTAVLIETLVLSAPRCAGRAATSSPPRTTPPRRSSSADGTPEDPKGVPVFAWKGESLEEYWECTNEILFWPDGELANMILDDGGDATMLVHMGSSTRRPARCPRRAEDDSEERKVFLELIRQTLAEGSPGSRSRTRSRASPRRRPPVCIGCTRCCGPARCCSPRSTSTTR